MIFPHSVLPFVRSVVRRDRSRVFEWTMSVAIFGVGINLILWPDAIEFSRFTALVYSGENHFIGPLCFLVGGLRLFTLVTSGRWLPWCARIRAIGAALSSVVWLKLGLALALTGLPPSPSIPIYMALVAGEIRTIARICVELHEWMHLARNR